MDRLTLAIEAAKKAGEVHLKYFGQSHEEKEVQQKKNIRDLVTKADKESEEVILVSITEAFPSDEILSEESGLHPGNSFQWIIDPLDGTANFVRGHKDFCAIIAGREDNETVFGIMWFPLTEELYVAQKGQGATRNGEPLAVSTQDDVSRMYGGTQMSSKMHSRKPTFEIYKGLLFEVSNMHVVISCIARSLADVAEGVLEFHYRKEALNMWDYAAGILLVEEAGGKVTDFDGNIFDEQATTVLASNGKNHDGLLSHIQSV